MREIKFRAWDKGHNRMSYKVNLYSLNKQGVMDKAQIDNQQVMKSIGFECEVMQFTGLLDKNGKEIYEGDIMEYDGNSVPMEISFCNGSFGVLSNPTKNGSSFGSYQIERGCIIGNIYENPELLSPLNPL